MDMLQRVKSLLPVKAWFTDVTPNLDAALAGIASGLSYAYKLYAYAKLQTRILTATDGWLDLIAADLFGLAVARKLGQTDASYRSAIRANLFLEKATRTSMAGMLKALTGHEPLIIEPTRPADCGAYDVPTTGYGRNGAYGSLLTPWQAFVTVYRPAGTGIPNVAGYDIVTGAYKTPSRAEYAAAASVLSQITDSDIYHAIDVTKPAGTIIWTRITSLPTADVKAPVAIPLILDGSWQLDGTFTLNGVKITNG
jgi:hypothetical protein